MKITYPLFRLSTAPTRPADLPSALYTNNEGGEGGFFGVGTNNFWHGGVHLHARDVPIRAIADGQIIAYRMNSRLQEATLEEGHPPRRFSSSFVLLKHELTSPKGSSVPFYSLYMHLKPMTQEETQQDSDATEAPHIFKKTHYVAASSKRGSGMPVTDESASKLIGVIPFGAHFTVHPDDSKCIHERYRKIKLLSSMIKGQVVLDPSKLKNPLPLINGNNGRILETEPVSILDDNLQPTGKSLPQHAFFVVRTASRQHAVLRYTKVVCLRRESTVGFITDTPDSTERVAGGYHRVRSAQPLFSTEDGTTLRQVPAEAYIALEPGALPANHWTRSAPHNVRRYLKVRLFPNAVTGFALNEPSRTASVKKTRRGQSLEVVDESKLLLETISGEEEYLSLEIRPQADSILTTLTVCSITYPDPAGAERVEGYAFLRIGYECMKLTQTASDTGNLHLWGESSMTAMWDASLLDDTGKAFVHKGRIAKLEDNSVFELLEDSTVAEEHWSRQARWRKVSFTYPPVQGQAEHTLEGYSFLGSHTTDVTPSGTPAGTPNRTYKLVKYISLRPTITHNPPANATIRYREGGGTSNYLSEEIKTNPDSSRAWDGCFNGINVHAAADSNSEVRCILGMGTTLRLKEPIAFTARLASGIPRWTPAVTKFCELTDLGYVNVDGEQVTKRTELPKPIVFDRVVALSPPLPINRGDILGLPGQTDSGEDQFHFEIFTDAHHFTQNPSADNWGPALVHIAADAAFRLRQVKPASSADTLTLGASSLVKVLEKDFSQLREPGKPVQFKITSAPMGWIDAADIDIGASAILGTLKKDIDKVYKDTVTVEKLVSTTETDEHGVSKSVTVKQRIQQVKSTGASYEVNCRTGQTVRVLQKVGESVQVDIVDDKVGWLARADFQAKTKNQGVDADKVYRYELSSAVTLFKSNPAGFYDLKEPEGAEGVLLRQKVAALPKTRRVDREWLQFDQAAVDRWTDSSGKKWVGVKVDPSSTLWFDGASTTTVSPAYDWINWQFLQEPTRGDDPATPHFAEHTFAQDGFCDLPSLLAIAGAPTRAASLPLLRRYAFQHPTEWQYQSDPAVDKWARLKQEPWNYDDAAYTRITHYIQSFQWWNSVPGLPAAQRLWHVHPIGFIEHLRGMFRLNTSQLIEIFGNSHATRLRNYTEALCATLNRYQITTPLRIAHFLAQTALESMVFFHTREEDPEDYQNKAGNKYPGDGRVFFGRGIMQLTGRPNYEAYELSAGEDITSSFNCAESVAEARLAFDSAGWFWDNRSLNAIADNPAGLSDFDVVKKITTRVNGGCNGFGMRMYYFKRAKAVLCQDIDG